VAGKRGISASDSKLPREKCVAEGHVCGKGRLAEFQWILIVAAEEIPEHRVLPAFVHPSWTATVKSAVAGVQKRGISDRNFYLRGIKCGQVKYRSVAPMKGDRLTGYKGSEGVQRL
jgi:hypothetical protein